MIVLNSAMTDLSLIGLLPSVMGRPASTDSLFLQLGCLCVLCCGDCRDSVVCIPLAQAHLSSCRFLCTQKLQRSRPSHLPLQQALGEEFSTLPPATPTGPGGGVPDLPTCHSSNKPWGRSSQPSHLPLLTTGPGEELSTFPPATPPTSPGEGALNLPTCHSSQQALGRSSRPSHLPLLQQALGEELSIFPPPTPPTGPGRGAFNQAVHQHRH